MTVAFMVIKFLKYIYFKLFNKKVYLFSIFLLMLSCLIFPNSLILISAASLLVCFLCAIPVIKLDKKLFLVLKFWIASSIVTLIYIIVGAYNGAPNEAIKQTFIVYIVTPFLWILVLEYLLMLFTLQYLVSLLVIACVMACFTVVSYYYFGINYGSEYIKILNDNPFADSSGIYTGVALLSGAYVHLGETALYKGAFVHQEGGFASTMMYVMGTLIFLMGGFFSSFNLNNNYKLNYCLALFFVLTALVSGRSALILSIPIGLFINCIFKINSNSKKDKMDFVKNAAGCIVVFIIVLIILDFLDLKFDKLVYPLIDKLLSFGGDGRVQQAKELMDGIINHWGLGAGHGIGVAYFWDATKPWSYELVWLSTVFKVGIIGAAVYAAPFMVMMLLGVLGIVKGRLNENEMFILGGGVCAFLATNTNQYIEGFVFQWMYVFPVLYFIKNKSINFSKSIR